MSANPPRVVSGVSAQTILVDLCVAVATARSLLCDLEANSNLVLETDTRLIERRTRVESRGEFFRICYALVTPNLKS